VISGVIHVLKSGARWVDAPSLYGPHKTLYNRYVRWAAKGVWVPKANRVWCFSPVLYRARNAIERMFCRLKDFRRIATLRPARQQLPCGGLPRRSRQLLL
jgi:transposase